MIGLTDLFDRGGPVLYILFLVTLFIWFIIFSKYLATTYNNKNWIKFLAAVAPLLGLLGTVIGMIETFQAITVFGTGDPKQMAGGISQALVTTMLGLIFAAPLLAMYTLLSEKVSEILQEIEEFVAITIVKKVK